MLVGLATTFAALLVTGISLIIYEARTYQRTLLDDLSTQAEILGQASSAALTFDDPKSARESLLLLKAKPGIAVAAIYNANGKLFASYARDDQSAQTLPSLPELDGSRIEGNQLSFFKRIIDNREILGTVYLRANYELWDRLRSYVGILAVVMAFSLVVALLMSVWLQATVTRPILAVTDAARQVMERRDFSLRVLKTTEDEVGYLVDAFNGMLAEVGRRAEDLEATNRRLQHEMTERERVQEDLRKLNVELEDRVQKRTAQLEEANKDLEGFSYTVSHDLRAPLRAIQSFSDLLVEDHAEQLDEEARRKLRIVQDEGQRMGTLIDELLAFSRLGRKEVRKVDVNMSDLARTSFERLHDQHQGPRVEFRLAFLPSSKGDRVLIGQVWTNLIANAVKFSSKRDKPVIEVSAVSDKEENVYFVRDNGAGFDPRYQAKLFGVFQRLHSASEFPGTGVGLALVQRIVVRHGGRVWADSQPNEGATFYFTLPKEQSNGTI